MQHFILRLEMLVEQAASGHEDKSQHKKYHEQARLIQQHASVA